MRKIKKVPLAAAFLYLAKHCDGSGIMDGRTLAELMVESELSDTEQKSLGNAHKTLKAAFTGHSYLVPCPPGCWTVDCSRGNPLDDTEVRIAIAAILRQAPIEHLRRNHQIELSFLGQELMGVRNASEALLTGPQPSIAPPVFVPVAAPSADEVEQMVLKARDSIPLRLCV